jgi:2-[(L-alanin-3-ylcarbamoyl)methyl]-2-hydroxybutanedioate decarboxylase
MSVSNKIVDAVLKARHPGHPFCAYVYDLDSVATHVRAMILSLPASCRLFYAVKANSQPEVLETLAPIVAGFDIASGGELEKVRAASSSSRLIFGGPGKTDDEIELGLRAGVDLFVVESVHELSRIDYIAGRLGMSAQVLLRVNLRRVVISGSYGMAGTATQFGIDEPQIAVAARHSFDCKNLVVLGLHLHTVSNNVDAERHIHFVAGCLKFADWACRAHGIPAAVVDAGGGFGIDYTGAGEHFDWAFFTKGLRPLAGANPDTELFFESGRFIAARCGYYATEVLDLKCNHDKMFAVVHGGRHHFRFDADRRYTDEFTVVEIPEWNYPFPRPAVHDMPLTVAGQLCTPTDILARDAAVARVRVGDILLFPLAGAYRWETSYHDFLSHPHPDRIVLPLSIDP